MNGNNNPLALPYSDFEFHRSVSTAAKGCAHDLHCTGHRLSFAPITVLPTLGVGKAASAPIIVLAAMRYKVPGFQFYVANQRNPDGSPGNELLKEPAHADMYLQPAEVKEQKTWLQTIVKGVRYKGSGHSDGA